MSAKKDASKRSLGSDLKRVDAHKIKAEEYDDLPELTPDMLADATLREGGKPVRRGRPPVAVPKKQVTIRLPADVLEAWKATGPGWQTRMAEKLSRINGAGQR